MPYFARQPGVIGAKGRTSSRTNRSPSILPIADPTVGTALLQSARQRVPSCSCLFAQWPELSAACAWACAPPHPSASNRASQESRAAASGPHFATCCGVKSRRMSEALAANRSTLNSKAIAGECRALSDVLALGAGVCRKAPTSCMHFIDVAPLNTDEVTNERADCRRGSRPPRSLRKRACLSPMLAASSAAQLEPRRAPPPGIEGPTLVGRPNFRIRSPRRLPRTTRP